MKITAIKTQSRQPGRVSVFVDERYGFSLSKDQLTGLKLQIGQDIDRDQLKKFQALSKQGKLRDSVYRWLSIRLRSDWEIRQYLAKKTNDEALREEVYKNLAEQGYVDDDRFAKMWIRHRSATKLISERRLKQELLQKRVPLEIIEQHISESDLDELARLKELIRKKQARYSDPQKLLAYLSRQGFSYGQIKQALFELEEES